MALLLHIDTSTEHASICVSRDNTILGLEESKDQKQHASFVQPAIANIIKEASITLNGVDAISVAAGPGSYTGLRVGLASAKGLCYALGKPLIMVNTLQIIAYAMQQANEFNLNDYFLCPMIDARRMEVFTAIYDKKFNSIQSPIPLILETTSFQKELTQKPLLFGGSGSSKWRNLITHSQAYFSNVQHNASHLAYFATIKYDRQEFEEYVSAEPYYYKGFFNPNPNINI